MGDTQIDKLIEVAQVNQQSRIKTIETAKKLYDVKIQLCQNELPILVEKLKSIENLPKELEVIVNTVEKGLCANKSLTLSTKQQKSITNILGSSLLKNISLSDKLSKEDAFATIVTVGAAVARSNIFRSLAKKKGFKKQLGERLVAIEDSTTVFNTAINRMENLLETVEEEKSYLSENITLISGGKRNYETLSAQEQKELLHLASMMNRLSEELTQKIEV